MTLLYSIVAKRSVDAPRIPFIEFHKLRNRTIITTISTISFYIRVTGYSKTNITKITIVASIATLNIRVVIPYNPKNIARL